MLFRVLLLSLFLLNIGQAATIDEVPSPVSAEDEEEFQFDLGYILGFVFTHVIPPLEDPDAFNQVTEAIAPQYAVWLRSLGFAVPGEVLDQFVPPSAQAPVATIQALSIDTLLPGVESRSTDMTHNPEPASLALIAGGLLAGWLRLRLCRRA